jgi:hypothetical protein
VAAGNEEAFDDVYLLGCGLEELGESRHCLVITEGRPILPSLEYLLLPTPPSSQGNKNESMLLLVSLPLWPANIY